MDLRHVYELRFVPQGTDGAPSHIVFSVGEQYLDMLQERLVLVRENYFRVMEKYFGKPTEFIPLEEDIFGNHVFGYGRCGYMDIEEGEAHIKFEIHKKLNPSYLSATMWMILKTFRSILCDAELQPSNRLQFISIDSLCQNSHQGHSIGGSVSRELGIWLKKIGKTIPESERDSFGRTNLQEVGDVMHQTWNVMTGNNLDANECRALIASDGHFSLICPGNACDVSIYPDQVYGDNIGNETVQFGCHNLNTAIQQITLIAGLAKLCELARNDQ